MTFIHFLYKFFNHLNFYLAVYIINFLLANLIIMDNGTTKDIYSLESLKKAHSQGRRFSFVFFYLDKDSDRLSEKCFSQFFPSQFNDINGERYSSCIQYMMSQKALKFNDLISHKKIMQTDDFRKIIQISNEIKKFDQKKWDECIEDIIYQGNIYKFSQNQELNKFLLHFPLDTIFIEANPDDKILGIHLKSGDPKSYNPFQWEGQNKLGFQITKVRDHLLTLASNTIKPIPTTPQICNINDLKKSISKGFNYNYVYFYQYIQKDLSLDPVTEGCLSQFFPIEFKNSKNVKYSSSIQYMMSEKAALFKDEEARNKIMKCTNQNEMRQLGERVKKFNQKVWDENCEDIVFKGNLLKFSQNQKLKDFLLSFPVNTIFAEADPNSSFWGIRLAFDSPKARNPLQWEGENKLGFQIVKVRDNLLNAKTVEKVQVEPIDRMTVDPRDRMVIGKESDDDDDDDEEVDDGKNSIVSFAYEDKIGHIANPEKVASLDFLSSGIQTLNLDNFPNLIRLRASKCISLKSANISNMRKLQVADFLDDMSLTEITFQNCPKLVALEAGFNKNLTKINGINNLKYLSAPRCPLLKSIDLPASLIFVDITDTPFVDFKKAIQQLQDLECLSISQAKNLKLSEITSNKSLKIIQMSKSKIICDSVKPDNKLIIIIFVQPKIDCEGNAELLNDFYVTSSSETNRDLRDFTMFNSFIPEYQQYQQMFYGPWGIPAFDLRPPVPIKNSIITPPIGIDHKRAADSILGSIFGSAIFDMIGVGVEFLPDGIAKGLLLGRVDISWSHPRMNSNNERFVRSTPTDDTSQNVLIMRSIIDMNTKPSNSLSTIEVNKVKINPCDFARKIVDWIKNGHAEHKHYHALDVGNSTARIAQNPYFVDDPFSAAEKDWVKNGRKIAANGSVMRIASSGCFAFWDEQVVQKVAEVYSKVTHFDPRCVFCSTAAALLIARYIQWNCGYIKKEPSIDRTLNEAMNIVPKASNFIIDIQHYCVQDHIERLELSEPNKIGYCLKAFGAGIWALRHCRSIKEALTVVLREGGDADTNGAVVGALLGAKLGFHKIPTEYIKNMFVGQWLFREVDPFMKLMGIEAPPSPFLNQ